MRIKDYIRKVFRLSLHDNDGTDAQGFPMHDESRPHLHVIMHDKRSIEYLSKEALEELEAEVYEIPNRARAAGM